MKYKINENIHISEVTGDYLIACMEKGGVLLKSKTVNKIVKVIAEQPITKEELLNGYFTDTTVNEAIIALYQLEQEGLITKSPSFFNSEQSAFWIEMGFNPQRLSVIFDEKKIDVKCVGKASKQTLGDLCEKTGIQFSNKPDLTVVITDSYAHKELEEYNQFFLEKQTPWLLIKTTGSEPLVGPLFNPQNEESACWKCLKQRLLLHDQESQLYQALKQTDEHLQRALINHPISEGFIAHIAILEVVEWL